MRWAAPCALLLATFAVGAGCGGEELVPASTLGEKLFADPKLSTSPFNVYACSTCHEVTPPAAAAGAGPRARVDPGFSLHNVIHRPSWWGGERTRLLDAINTCLFEFMGGRELEATDDQARQLYEFLAVNSPQGPAEALPITVVKNITGLTELNGDSARGKALWDASCGRCHGDPHTGRNILTARAGIVPEQTVAVFGVRARDAVIEKVRHGKFFHIGGIMPLYALETLTDQELVDILTFIGL
jgi:thiosulfate dehydrogenase